MKNNLDVEQINPKLNPAFSPTLYRRLRHAKYRHRAPFLQLYTSSWGTQYLGYLLPDGEFIGANVYSWMTPHSPPKIGVFTNARDFTLVPDFWERYLKVGRCALDPKHEVCFQPSVGGLQRWTTGKVQRVCNWCGLRQRARVVEQVKQITIWKTIK